jgi:hypothetical protein
LKIENRGQADGSGDRRDAEELAGADKEEVEAGIIDLLSARLTVLVHRAKKRHHVSM